MDRMNLDTVNSGIFGCLRADGEPFNILMEQPGRGLSDPEFIAEPPDLSKYNYLIPAQGTLRTICALVPAQGIL